MKTPLLGGTYISRSSNLASDECINLYPELVETKQGKEVGALYSCPGLTLLTTVGSGPHRGARRVAGQLYVVSGNGLYRVTQALVATLLGTLLTGNGPVSIIDNGTQLAIVDGGQTVYVWNTSTSTFSQVSLGFNATTIWYQDGYGLANQAGTKQWSQSNLNDLSTWGALNFSSADGQPDNIIGGIDINRESWLMKENGIEIWLNAGTSGFAFQRLQGVYIEQGCAAPFSICKTLTGPIWLGFSERGQGAVWMANGYRAQRVSTHAMETELKTYPTISDAQGFVYEDAGHLFYVLTFPTANVTWCLDVSQEPMLWHKRLSFSNGQFARHQANSFAFAYGKLIVGDYQNGNLYSLDLENYTDNGAARKWLRRWRALPPNKQATDPLSFNSLRIDFERGITVPQGTVPQMMLRWSDDGAHTWSNELVRSAGAPGETALFVKFDRMGSTRLSSGLDRTFELSSLAPIRAALINAELEVS